MNQFSFYEITYYNHNVWVADVLSCNSFEEQNTIYTAVEKLNMSDEIGNASYFTLDSSIIFIKIRLLIKEFTLLNYWWKKGYIEVFSLNLTAISSDIPGITSRLFYTKFLSLIKDIENGLFGKIPSYVFTIEFQKRGLPHAHLLCTLHPNDKLLTPSSINKHISAEIPTDDRELQKLVLKHMLHGPILKILYAWKKIINVQRISPNLLLMKLLFRVMVIQITEESITFLPNFFIKEKIPINYFR